MTTPKDTTTRDDPSTYRRRHDDDDAFDLVGVDLCAGDVLPTDWNHEKRGTSVPPTSTHADQHSRVGLAMLLARRDLAGKAAWIRAGSG
jgi:hypothetical protein